MRALLGNGAMLEDEDALGHANRRHAMGDQDGRAAFHDSRQCAQNSLFGERVHACQRVIQNQQTRIAQHRAGNGRALLLASGKRNASLADNGSEPVRKGLDIRSESSDFSGRSDLLGRGFRYAERDVFGDGRGEQERLLRHHADLPAEVRGVECPQRNSIQPHFARGRILQPRDEADQGCLTAARVADYRHGRARLNAQIQAFQRGARVKLQSNVAKLDLAANR